MTHTNTSRVGTALPACRSFHLRGSDAAVALSDSLSAPKQPYPTVTHCHHYRTTLVCDVPTCFTSSTRALRTFTAELPSTCISPLGSTLLGLFTLTRATNHISQEHYGIPATYRCFCCAVSPSHLAGPCFSPETPPPVISHQPPHRLRHNLHGVCNHQPPDHP